MNRDTTPALEVNAGRRLSDGELARTLVEAGGLGVLSTNAARPAGYPFGSLTPYATNEQGGVILLTSTLAEHTKNFLADPRASLIVLEGKDKEPVQAGRVTVLGEVSESTQDSDRGRYLKAHPSAQSYADFKDFAFYVLQVSSVRFVAGFGRMSWVKADDYADAEPDPIVPVAHEIADHVNKDHKDALVDLCILGAGIDDVTDPEMTDVDRFGFDVRPGADSQTVRFAFERTAIERDSVRVELIRLLTKARRMGAPK